MTNNVPDRLSAKQLLAVPMLAIGTPTADVADAVHTTPRTVRRWLHDERVKRVINEFQRDLLESNLRKLRSMGPRALACLDEVMELRDGPPTARVSAAKVVWESILKAAELETYEDLEARLRALEGRR